MEPYFHDDQVTLYLGHDVDVLRALPSGSVACIVTSPPYFGLRDYGEPGQRGQEATPGEYVAGMLEVFTEAHRVLADDGTLWLNLGDSYAGKANGGPTRDRHRGHGHRAGITTVQRNMLAHAPYKSLLMMPERVALALVDAGWVLRNKIVWDKPNAMPESVKDRFTTSYEPVYLFTKTSRYWFDLDALREPLSPESIARARAAGTTLNPAGRNPGDVWSIPTAPYPEAHFATMPPELAERCILAGAKPGGTVLDIYSGSGTTGMVAARHERPYIGIDLSAAYLNLSLRDRLRQPSLLMAGVAS